MVVLLEQGCSLDPSEQLLLHARFEQDLPPPEPLAPLLEEDCHSEDSCLGPELESYGLEQESHFGLPALGAVALEFPIRSVTVAPSPESRRPGPLAPSSQSGR